MRLVKEIYKFNDIYPHKLAEVTKVEFHGQLGSSNSFKQTVMTDKRLISQFFNDLNQFTFKKHPNQNPRTGTDCILNIYENNKLIMNCGFISNQADFGDPVHGGIYYIVTSGNINELLKKYTDQ